jgi:hypothetical protein
VRTGEPAPAPVLAKCRPLIGSLTEVLSMMTAQVLRYMLSLIADSGAAPMHSARSIKSQFLRTLSITLWSSLSYPGEMSSTSPVIHRSCSFCQDLKPVWPSPGRVAFTDVQKSADSGCAGCAVLSVIVPPYLISNSRVDACLLEYGASDTELIIKLSYSKWAPSPSLWALRIWTLTRKLLQYCEVWKGSNQLTNTADTCPWSVRTPNFAVRMNASKSESTTQLQEWVQKCLHGHEQCRQATQASILPTRVIEILAPQVVRLAVPHNLREPYTCLSHCWGTTQFIQTTMGTIDRFRNSIPWDDLPKTFQDAIDVTNQLGIKYIWIDSLCILQVRVYEPHPVITH